MNNATSMRKGQGQIKNQIRGKDGKLSKRKESNRGEKEKNKRGKVRETQSERKERNIRENKVTEKSKKNTISKKSNKKEKLRELQGEKEIDFQTLKKLSEN